MNDTWYAIIGGIITTIVSSFVSWFFAKRKYNAEVDNHLITNMQESLEFYKALADDNKVRLESVLQENAELRKEIHELRTEQQMLMSVLAKYGLQKLVENNEPEEQ
jgi:cell division protein FtsB